MKSARETAYDLTRRVHEEGGYLSLLLRYHMRRGQLDRRDRALVAELAYGVQRQRNKLDHALAAFSARPLDQLDPRLLDVLRLGMYQLMEMRTPQHAAVNEMVELAKKRLGAGAASYVNAVLRRASENLQGIAWPSRDDPQRYLETVLSHPRWLVEYLIGLLGTAEAESLCAIDNEVPGLTLRVNDAKTDAASLLRTILSRGGSGRLSSVMPSSLVEVHLSYEHLLELLEEGLCVVQDESSMLVAYAVAPRPGEVVVDACAAPGGKATHIAQLGGERCRVVAVDRNARRLAALRTAVSRLGLSNIEVRQGDASRLTDHVEGGADAVLLDAPCSGLGTLRRNPELKWRRLPTELPRFADLQYSLLVGCAKAVRAGGALVYSVCTYTREETTDVIGRFLSSWDGFSLQDLRRYMPPAASSWVHPQGYLQLMPHLHHMEGMFVARMVRGG